MKTINLQNTPELKGVSSEAVSFDSSGATLKGIPARESRSNSSDTVRSTDFSRNMKLSVV